MSDSKTKRRFRRLYSETVLSLVKETKKKPSEVSELAKSKVSAEWAFEFGSSVKEDWHPEKGA